MLSNIILILLVITLVIATVTDLWRRMIPNVLTLTMIVLFGMVRIITGEWGYFIGLAPALIFFILYLKWPEGLGAGDIKLLAVIGLALGPIQTIGIIFWMCLGFTLVVVTTKFLGKSLFSLPLAPFMMVGFIITSITSLMI